MKSRHTALAGLGLAILVGGCSPAASTGPEVMTSTPPLPAGAKPVEGVAPHGAVRAPASEPVAVASANAPAPAAAPAPVAESKIDPLRQAQQLLQAGKIDDGIKKVEEILKDEPKNRQALGLLTMAYESKATSMTKDRKASIPVFLQAAKTGRELRASQKDLNSQEKQLLGMAFYNEACSLAIDDKPDQAMAALKEAFEVGFNEMATFEGDAELDSLRKRPDFIAMKAELSGGKLAKMLKENKPFPLSFKLEGIDGKPLTTDDLKGKVAIVDFWGTWCPPCRKEIPVLVDIYNKYHDKGFEIVGINCNEGPAEQAKKKVQSYLEENKVPYRCALSDEKVETQIPDLEGYPTTLFLDRTGKVRLKMVGFDPNEKGMLEEIVKTLLEEK